MDVNRNRVEAIDRLARQVELLVTKCGDPEGFDARAWVAKWIDRPLPALGWKKRPRSPIDPMV